MSEVLKAKSPDPLFTKQDLARLFGVSEASIDGWRKSNRIPAPTVFVGRRPFWSRDIRRTLRRRTSAQPA